jgi:hypothetical protein
MVALDQRNEDQMPDHSNIFGDTSLDVYNSMLNLLEIV